MSILQAQLLPLSPHLHPYNQCSPVCILCVSLYLLLYHRLIINSFPPCSLSPLENVCPDYHLYAALQHTQTSLCQTPNDCGRQHYSYVYLPTHLLHLHRRAFLTHLVLRLPFPFLLSPNHSLRSVLDLLYLTTPHSPDGILGTDEFDVKF